MMRHTKMVRNRQQAMLNRVADEIGLDVDTAQYRAHIQGKNNVRADYDRSNAAMS